MKKLLLSAAVVISSMTANAQLADGSAAPDFTFTDQFGQSHTLSTYLAQGKTVILDVFATWCGPCWSYHNAHHLKNLYDAYGPEGSDEVMVFSIDGDPATTDNDLAGTGGNTQGDWLDGTPYPMANHDQINNLYAIAYYPTIYRICPDGMGGGVVYEEGQSTTAQLVTSIQNNCGQTLVGANDHAGLHDGMAAVCSTDGVPSVDFTNYGTNAITSATVILKENGTQVASQSFAGNVAQFADGTVTFPAMPLNQGSTYTAEMTDINGNAPNSTNTTVSNFSVVTANLTGYSIQVDFYTDNYPSETSYEIRNSSNQVVATAGPWQPGTDDQWGGGGPDALTTHTNMFTLPTADECYSVRMIDSYGDGQQYGTNPAGQYGMSIKSGGQEVFNYDPGNFGSQIDRPAAIRTELGSSSVAEFTVEGLNVYPNPATDVLNVTFDGEGEHTIALTDLSGRVLATQSYDAKGSVVATFSVANLANGSYMVSVTNNAGTHVENVVIK